MYFGVNSDEEIGNLLATSWHSGGTQFVTTHEEGYFLFYDINCESKPFRISRPHGWCCDAATVINLASWCALYRYVLY